MPPPEQTDASYRRDLAAACDLMVRVRADLLMEFAYASRALKEWLDGGYSGGATLDELLNRWEAANLAAAGALEFVPRGVRDAAF